VTESTAKLERTVYLPAFCYKRGLVHSLKVWFAGLGRERRLRRLEAERAICIAAVSVARRRGDTRALHTARESLKASTHACLRMEISR